MESKSPTGRALLLFSKEGYLTVCHNNEVIGFMGCFPDYNSKYINIFTVIIPSQRGKKYFSAILVALINYCQSRHPKHKQLRSLTRKDNIAAIRGLQSIPFKYVGKHIEEFDENPENDIEYEEYILDL